MNFHAYVTGESVEDSLRPFIADHNEFIIDLDLQDFADQYGLPLPADELLKTLRTRVESDGQIALVDPHQVNDVCRRLYKAGFRHFLTLTDEGLFTIKRLLSRRPEYAKHPTSEEEVSKAPKILDYSLATSILTCGFIRKGEGDDFRYASLPIKDIDFPLMIEVEASRIRDAMFTKDGSFQRSIERAKQEGNHLMVDLLSRVKLNSEEGDLDDYVMDQARANVLPHALVTEEGWSERGRLDWRGIVSEPIPWQEWEIQIFQTLAELDPNTTLSIVDCEC